MPNLEESAISRAVKIWDVVGSMKWASFENSQVKRPISFLDWPASRRVKIRILILRMKSAD